MSLDPRAILEALVARLAPEVGDVEDWHFSYWGDDTPDTTREYELSGKVHLARALAGARDALASDDPDSLAFAALIFPTYERTGRARAQRFEAAHRAAEEKAQRTAGGKRRGASQAAAAAEHWQPWVARFEALTGKGVAPEWAHKTVADEMAAAGLPVPSDVTLRKRLPGKSKGS
jgi:hypothetical protein